MLSSPEIKAEVKIIFQTVEDLHIVSQTLGIGTTGDYPTPGGIESLTAFMNFYEGKMLEHTSKFVFSFNRFLSCLSNFLVTIKNYYTLANHNISRLSLW
jgi:hypothetical protein